MRRRTAAPLFAVFAIVFAFGAAAQEVGCADGDAFVAAVFSDSAMKPNAAPAIQWQRLDAPDQASPKLTLTWSPAKQKNVFRAAADRFWNRTPAPAPAPAPQPIITSSASVFSIDPNRTTTHSAFTRGFAMASITTTDPHVAQDANDVSLNYVDPRALSSLNATWQTPWWGLMLSGAFRYLSGEAATTGQADLRVGKGFSAGSKKIIIFAECANCTNRTVSIISTDIGADGNLNPSTPRFFQIAARVDF